MMEGLGTTVPDFKKKAFEEEQRRQALKKIISQEKVFLLDCGNNLKWLSLWDLSCRDFAGCPRDSHTVFESWSSTAAFWETTAVTREERTTARRKVAKEEGG